MTYRDEKDALAARNVELEAKLAAANAKVAELRGQKVEAGVAEGETVSASGVIGTLGIRFRTELDHEIDVAGYEAIARLLKERLQLSVTQVGNTLEGPRDSFRLTGRGGRTEIELRGDWSGLSGTVYSAGFFGAMLGFLPVVGLLHDLAHLPDATSVPLGLVTGALAVVGGVALTRRSMRRRAEEKLRDHRGVVAAILELAEQHRVREPAAKVRVAADEPAVERDLPSEEETLAEEAVQMQRR